MTALFTLFTLAVLAVLAGWGISKLMDHYFDMDTDDSTDEIVEYPNDNDDCYDAKRAAPLSKYHVATRLREIATTYADAPNKAALVFEAVDLDLQATDAGWLDRDSVDAQLSSFLPKDGPLAYRAFLNWLADTIDPASSAKVAA